MVCYYIAAIIFPCAVKAQILGDPTHVSYLQHRAAFFDKIDNQKQAFLPPGCTASIISDFVGQHAPTSQSEIFDILKDRLNLRMHEVVIGGAALIWLKNDYYSDFSGSPLSAELVIAKESAPFDKTKHTRRMALINLITWNSVCKDKFTSTVSSLNIKYKNENLHYPGIAVFEKNFGQYFVEISISQLGISDDISIVTISTIERE
jgi:hypothetical protein